MLIITIGTVISCPGGNDTVKYCLPAGRKNYLIKINICSIMKYTEHLFVKERGHCYG